MKRQLYKWFYDWLWGPEIGVRDIWHWSTLWERDHSNDWELWKADGEAIQRRNSEAGELVSTDAALALAIYQQLADEGSVWAMRHVGDAYYAGWLGKRDFNAAEMHYRKALALGSESAILNLAKCLRAAGNQDEWEEVLENGVERGFLPANFWLAFFRFRQKPSRETSRDVRPVMLKAADAGHPAARMILATWKARGRFGLAEVRNGFREFSEVLEEVRSKSASPPS